MLETLRRLWDNTYLRITLVVLAIFFVGWLLRRTQIAWGSFTMAYVLAYIANPLVQRLEKRARGRWLGVLLVMLIILIFWVFGVILLVQIIDQLLELRDPVADLLASLQNAIQRLPTWAEQVAPLWLVDLIAQNREALNEYLANLRNTLLLELHNNATDVLRGVGGVLGFILQAVLVYILTGYVLAGYPRITEGFYQLFPERSRHLVYDLSSKLDHTVGSYIRAKTWEAIIVGLVSWLVLWILGVPQAAGLGFVAGLLNPIPYVGPTLSVVPVVLLALTQSWQLALAAGIAMVIIQQLDGHILAPVLLSRAVKISPVMVIVALLFGSSLFGFWGVLLAIPAAAFGQILYNDYYLTSKWYKRGSRPEDTALFDDA